MHLISVSTAELQSIVLSFSVRTYHSIACKPKHHQGSLLFTQCLLFCFEILVNKNAKSLRRFNGHLIFIDISYFSFYALSGAILKLPLCALSVQCQWSPIIDTYIVQVPFNFCAEVFTASEMHSAQVKFLKQ